MAACCILEEDSQMQVHVHVTACHIYTIAGKAFEREKLVENTTFSEKTFIDCSLLLPKDATSQNFTKITFTNSHKFGKSFHLQKIPTVWYVKHSIRRQNKFVATDPYLPSTVRVPALVGPIVLPSLRLALQVYSPASCRPTRSMSSCRFSVLWITSESIGSLLCSHSNVT